MRTYSLPESGFRTLRNKIIIRSLPLMVISSGIGIYAGIGRFESRPELLLFVVLIILIAAVVGIVRAMRMQKEQWVSYRLELTDYYILRRQAYVPDLKLKANEVTRVIELADGTLVVQTKSPMSFISIPGCIENRGEIRSGLEAMADITTATSSKNQIMWVVALLAFILVYAAAYISDDPKIVVPTALVAIVGSAVCAYITIATKVIDERVRKSGWLIVFPIGALFVKLCLAWQAW